MSSFPYKLGALAPRQVYGVHDLAVYATVPLPVPPPAVAAPSVPTWRMMLNNVYGCCVVAGAGHSELAWNADVSESDPVPTDTQIEAEYFGDTGGQDTGLVEATFLRKWRTEGCWGSKITGYVPVQPQHLERIHQAIAYYGVCYVGVALPQSAQTQFGAGEPWTVVPGSPIEGGHCIIFVGYDQRALYAVTWGKLVEITYPWWARYGTEAWCILPHQFAEAGRGPLLDLAHLESDLNQVTR